MISTAFIVWNLHQCKEVMHAMYELDAIKKNLNECNNRKNWKNKRNNKKSIQKLQHSKMSQGIQSSVLCSSAKCNQCMIIGINSQLQGLRNFKNLNIHVLKIKIQVFNEDGIALIWHSLRQKMNEKLIQKKFKISWNMLLTIMQRQLKFQQMLKNIQQIWKISYKALWKSLEKFGQYSELFQIRNFCCKKQKGIGNLSKLIILQIQQLALLQRETNAINNTLKIFKLINLTKSLSSMGQQAPVKRKSNARLLKIIHRPINNMMNYQLLRHFMLLMLTIKIWKRLFIQEKSQLLQELLCHILRKLMKILKL